MPVREGPRDVHGERARSDDQEDRGTDDRGGALHGRSMERTHVYVERARKDERSVTPIAVARGTNEVRAQKAHTALENESSSEARKAVGA